MQIVTYLGFTLLSIFIQFSVIDFIQGRLKVDEKVVDLKGTSQKRQLRDVLKDVNHKPHALYYRTQKTKAMKNLSPARFFSNTSLTELYPTTDMTTTVFDILYDENTTGTEESFTTESLYTSSDIENVTEINFFGKTNDTTSKTDMVPKTAIVDCSCNFLFRVCDLYCCCDSDCLDSEIELFPNCAKNKSKINKQNRDDDCVCQLPYFGYENGLFCIVKINLPETLMHQKIEQKAGHFMAWKSSGKPKILHEFSNTIYKYGDPIWIIRNDTIYHTDLPSQTVNNYCTGRKAIQFLKDENYSCNVKIGDLEMLQIIKSLEEISVISATPFSMNSSVLNCTTLHCVNWTNIVCNNRICTMYNKSLHEPTCTESICTNLALRVDYIFYYHESKIINATIKFYLENTTMDLPFIAQEIKVKFVLGNVTVDEILKLSGSPGYEHGLPIIASFAEINYTNKFYNTMPTKRYLLLPENQHGFCMLNDSKNLILFGRNRRINCRYNHTYIKLVNSTDECYNIQNNINKFLEPNKKVLVSPLGNPLELKDKDWLSIEKFSLFERPLYGRVQDHSSKLLCFNLITRYSIVFSYAQMYGNNRIVSCKYETTAKNATFNMEDISTVLTIDISFIDVTKPSVFEYITGPPNLNIHLPDDFFYPFRSNESRILKGNVVFTMILYFIIIVSWK